MIALAVSVAGGGGIVGLLVGAIGMRVVRSAPRSDDQPAMRPHELFMDHAQDDQRDHPEAA